MALKEWLHELSIKQTVGLLLFILAAVFLVFGIRGIASYSPTVLDKKLFDNAGIHNEIFRSALYYFGAFIVLGVCSFCLCRKRDN